MFGAAGFGVYQWLSAREVWLSLHDAVSVRAPRSGSDQALRSLGDTGRTAILAHPPARMEWSLQLRPGEHHFRAAIAIDPDVARLSDGVNFRVRVLEAESIQSVVDARFVPEEQGAISKPIAGKFRSEGAPISLVLETGPGAAGRTDYDWAYWVEPRIQEGTHLPLIPLGVGALVLLAGCWASPGSGPRMLQSGVLQRVAALGLGLAIACLAAEGLLRVFPLLVPVTAAKRLPDGGASHYAGQTGEVRWDTDLGFLPLPNRCWSYARPAAAAPDEYRDPSPIEFCTDAEGFRNPMRREAPVVAIGDSFVQGTTIDYGGLWTTRLATQLGTSVANLGVDGYSPEQSVSVLEEYGLARKPRLVLFALFEGNDLDDTLHYRSYRESGLRWDAFIAGAIRARSVSLSHARLEWMRLWALTRHAMSAFETANSSAAGFNPIVGPIAGRRVQMAFHGLLLYRATLSRERREASEAWALLRTALENARSLCRRDGVALVVVLFPAKETLYPTLLEGSFAQNAFEAFVADSAPPGAAAPESWYSAYRENRESVRDLLVEYLAREAYAFVDLRDAFAAAASVGEVLYWPYDSHLNQRGNALAAARIADRVRRLDLSLARSDASTRAPSESPW